MLPFTLLLTIFLNLQLPVEKYIGYEYTKEMVLVLNDDQTFNIYYLNIVYEGTYRVVNDRKRELTIVLDEEKDPFYYMVPFGMKPGDTLLIIKKNNGDIVMKGRVLENKGVRLTSNESRISQLEKKSKPWKPRRGHTLAFWLRWLFTCHK